MINGGFIRANRVYGPGSELTVAQVLEELPFPRECVCVELRGADVLD